MWCDLMAVGFLLLLIGFLLLFYLPAFYFVCLADTGSNLFICPSAFLLFQSDFPQLVRLKTQRFYTW